MGNTSTFNPQSATMLVAVGAGAATQALAFPGSTTAVLGPTVPPPVARVCNLSTAVVWVSFTIAARTAAIPAAGQTSFELPIQPGATETFQVPFAQGSAGAEGSAGPPNTASINCNTIGTVAGSISVTFGEGM